MTAQQKITSKIEARSTASLREMATALYSDVRDGSEIVLAAVLDALMTRMSDADFVAFCAVLEG